MSDIVCPDVESPTLFEFPSQEVIEKYKLNGVIPYLVGLENSQKDGKGFRFNFILSNGERSEQRDDGKTYYTHFMPVEA